MNLLPKNAIPMWLRNPPTINPHGPSNAVRVPLEDDEPQETWYSWVAGLVIVLTTGYILWLVCYLGVTP